MEQIERIGVSLDKKLLTGFDKLIEDKGYQSRSEAIRDLIRKEISEKKADDPKSTAIAVVSLVYNHHSTRLMQKLTQLQHSHLLQTISSLHIHLDEHDCMEIIVLKGRVAEINSTAERLLSQKGVKLGKINLVSVDAEGHA